MTSNITIALVVLSFLNVVYGNYLCNCYCPTRTKYVGYVTYVTSSTVCNTLNCASTCVGRFSSCTLGSTYGSCRSAGNGPNISQISLIIGLSACFLKRFL